MWEFIQACFPDKLSNSGFLFSVWQHLIAYYSRVKVHLEHHSVAHFILCHKLFLSLLGIHIHAAEFVHLELSAVPADSLLREEYRSRRGYVYRRSHKYHDDKCEQTAHQSSDYIHAPLYQKCAGICIVHARCDYCVVAYLFYLLITALGCAVFGYSCVYCYSHLQEYICHLLRIFILAARWDEHLIHPLIARIVHYAIVICNYRYVAYSLALHVCIQ